MQLTDSVKEEPHYRHDLINEELSFLNTSGSTKSYEKEEMVKDSFSLDHPWTLIQTAVELQTHISTKNKKETENGGDKKQHKDFRCNSKDRIKYIFFIAYLNTLSILVSNSLSKTQQYTFDHKLCVMCIMINYQGIMHHLTVNITRLLIAKENIVKSKSDDTMT